MMGGDSPWGRLAMYRTRLGLSEEELMNKPWISVIMEICDLPYYDIHGKEKEGDPESKKVIKVTSKEEADKVLKKYM